MWMWLCEGKLKVKIAHFRLPSASQKRACLSSLSLPWNHVKRSAFQNKRLAVSQMAFRARNVFGTFEKRAPCWQPRRRSVPKGARKRGNIVAETLVVYHFPQKSENFGWNVNVKPILVFPNRKFSGKNGISWKVVQNSQTDFPNGKPV